MADDAQEQLIPCSWQGAGDLEVLFAVTEIRETYGRRVVPRTRVYKDGQKLDDTGEDAISWEIDALFFNGMQAPETSGAEEDQYPGAIDRFCIALRIVGTGDLTLSTRGARRARVKGYRRTDSSAFRNGATITLTFLEDSEDDITAASFSKPAAKVAASAQALDSYTFATDEGAGASLLQQLNELASGLQELANAPGEFVDSLEAQAKAIGHLCSKVESTFANAAARAQGDTVMLLTNPSAAPGLRSLRKLSDTAMRAASEAAQAAARGPRIVSRTFSRTMSIFDVAVEVGNTADQLMGINGSIPDMLAIAPGTPVRTISTGA